MEEIDYPERNSPWPKIVGAAVAVVVVLIVFGIVHVVRGRIAEVVEANAGKSLAIVTFANIGGDSAQQYLADGISEDLSLSVGAIPEIHLAPRQAAAAFKGKSPQSFGAATKVKYLLDGTVRRSPSHVRLSARLVSVSDGRELWAGVAENDAGDLFAAEANLDAGVLQALHDNLQVDVPREAALRPGTTNAQAYDAYLRARYLLAKGNEQATRRAETFYEEAVSHDSSFGHAYAGLAMTQVIIPQYEAKTDIVMLTAAIASSRRAAKLAPSDADAYLALGRLSYFRSKWSESETLMKHALELDPSSIIGRRWYADVLVRLDNMDEALEQLQTAQKLDSGSAAVANQKADLLFRMRRAAASQEGLTSTVGLDTMAGTGVKDYATATAFVHGSTEVIRAFRDVVALDPTYPGARGRLAFILAEEQKRDEALAIDAQLQRDAPAHRATNYEVAVSRIGLGDAEGALSWLSRSFAANEIEVGPRSISCDPYFAALRPDVRYVAMLRKAGIRSCQQG